MKPWDANPSGFDSLSNFMGEIPEKYLLVLLTRNRDSDILAESNWATVLKFLGGESETVQIVRHGHWACGWIEYLMIDSRDKDMLALAESVEKKLSDYPIWDEDDFSSREWEAACSFWESMSVRERVDVITRYGKPYVSVFAARRSELPQNDNGNIFQYLTQ